MTPADVIDLGQQTMIVILKIGGPLMVVSLIVGLGVSLLQALTQIQEMTLSFIPKIIATFVVLWLAMPFIGRTLDSYARDIFDRIVGLGL